MSTQNLAALSLLADIGNGEVQNPATDLPLVNGQDASVSTPGRIVHWDTEWHWDATYTQYAHQALGGHIVALGLKEAHQIWDESTFPIFSWAHQQNAIAGFAHMQYLDSGFPQTLTCCTPVEYPVEVGLGSADFISEDVNGGDSAITAYYRLLNSGFRPGFAAGTDYPCNDGTTVGSPLTYVRVVSGTMTYRNWIDGIANGHTVVSLNGHNEFVDLKVNGSAGPGDEVFLTGGGTVPVTIQWTATQNLTGTIELVANGVVVASKQASVSSGSGSTLTTNVTFSKSGWLAARRMGSNGHVVHTAAVFVTLDHGPVRANSTDPQFYVQWMDNLLTNTSPGGSWNSYFPTELNMAQARYRAAKALYQQIAEEAQGTAPALSSITVTPANSTMSSGSTQQFTATGNYSDGTSLNITGQVSWSSSNPSVATINLRGLALGVNPGTTVVSARQGGIAGDTSITVQIPPLLITPQSLPAGTVNIPYSATFTATGGTPPYSWSISSGSLPAGIALNSGTGVISGTSALAGTYNFTIRVVDSGSPAQAATQAQSIVIAPAGSCPCTIWPSTTVPSISDSGPDSAVEIGVKFRSDSDGFITGIRFYKGSGNTGTHVGNLWTSSGTRLATATFTNETSSGWQQVNFSSPVAINANTIYVASYFASLGHYADDQYYFSIGVDRPPLHALADGLSGANGVFAYGPSSSFPSQGWNSSNYWVDVVFTPSGADVTPPTIASVTPPAGAASVAVNTTATATFNEAMDASTISTATFILRDSQNADVPASVTYDSSRNTAVLTPTAPLQYSAGYTGLLKGGSTDPRVKDLAGNALAGNFTWAFTTVGPDTTPPVISNVSVANITLSGATVSWTTNEPSDSQVLYGSTAAYGLLSAVNSSLVTAHSIALAGLAPNMTYHFAVKSADASGNLATSADGIFTTASSGGSGNSVSLWLATATPALADSGPDAAVNLGVRFHSDQAGTVTGIRFYKASTNTGTHTGNLFTVSGTLLASVMFTNETASGWQQANFSSPVVIAANTDYIASYSCPNGHYSADQNYFSSQRDVAPLHAPAGSVSAPNGSFAYGAAGAFPNQGYYNSNYWVDVVLLTSADTTPPSVLFVAPANGATAVSVSSFVSVSFSEAIDPATLTASTFQLKDASNNLIPGSVTWDSGSNTAHLQPTTALSYATTYTATVKGGATDPRVKDLSGNALASDYSWLFTTTEPPPPPPPGSTTPILLVTSSANGFSGYYAEILRNEGFTEFSTADIGQLSATSLSNYDVVLLPQTTLTTGQVSTLQNWVSGGGNLIAMRPDKRLAPMLGLNDAGSTLSDAYLTVNTAIPPGYGITGQSIQFHDTADLYTLNGATNIATLYRDASTALSNPAVAMNNYGAGQAAFFAYDLARSVVFTRQGNPAWSGQERDGVTPIRSDDLYFGGSQPDYLDLNKVSIPQADEQQRLLANLILTMNLTRRPLPRLWYLPRGLKAAVVMTGDDHGNGGTVGRWDTYIADSPANCSVDNWECVRGTSYAYPGTPITDAEAQHYSSLGFEFALHLLTGCQDFTPASLEDDLSSQLTGFTESWPSLAAPKTNRTHCIVWSDYDTEPQLERNHGIRLDTNYYYWPGSWILDRPGFMTGSGMPMKFATRSGAVLDIYQAATQMTDESDQTYPFTIDTLLDNAVGPLGYYGVFTANMHTDYAESAGSDAIVASAQAHGVPIVSAQQMLTWLDGRNGSTISAVSWDGTNLGFQLQVAAGANGLKVMIPVNVGAATLNRVLLNNAAQPFSTQWIKGIQYAFVSGDTGTYQAVYGGSLTAVLSSFSISPTQVTGGAPLTGTVTLDNPAPSGGAMVTLSSDNPAVNVPASVTVAAGATSASFTAATSPVAISTVVNVTASYLSSSRTAALTVSTSALSSIALNPTSVVGGNTSTATVTLSGPAPTNGLLVNIASSNTAIATVPSSTITIPAGSTNAQFTVTTTPVSAQSTVSLSAISNGSTRSATLTVRAPSLASLTLNPTSVRRGTNSTGTVTLDGITAVSRVITLSSSNTNRATVPISVTIPAGASSAAFTLTTSSRSNSGSVTITASSAGVTQRAVLTITP